MCRKRLLAAIASACALVAVTALCIRAFTPSRAPDVTLDIIGEGRRSLAQVRGDGPLLLTFWATDCRSCRAEIPHLVELDTRYRAAGLTILAVAMAHDPPSRVWSFAQRNALPYKVALDTDRAAAEAFGHVRLTPTTYLIAADGRIVYHTTGPFDPSNVAALVDGLLSARG